MGGKALFTGSCERVVERALAGESIRAVEAMFGVSPSGLSNSPGGFARLAAWLGQMNGHKPVILATDHDLLLALCPGA